MSLIESLSAGLGLPIPFLKGIARKASHAYKVYEIPKRSGGFREIAHPARQLKSLQRWLLFNVLHEWPVHAAASAYVRGSNLYRHASKHAASRYLLRLDFEQFFPSIKSADVSAYLEHSPQVAPSWTAEDRSFFVQIVTRFGALTIGAPTSPALSNALCYDLDLRCAAIAADQDCVYTRYADDLFFSTTRPNVLHSIPTDVRKIAAGLSFPAHLRLNTSKQRHLSRKWRRIVTGVVLTSDGRACLGRARKRFIRSQIHMLDALTEAQKTSLRGLISYAADIEPLFINDLILKYGHGPVMRAWKASVSDI